MESNKYRPSNGTEGESFMERYCYRCKHESPQAPCPIIGNTMAHDVDDEQYPTEWIYGADGKPTCTKFEPIAAPELPPFVRRGRGDPPKPMQPGQQVIRLKVCPDCQGRGTFLINPFATSHGGFGGITNLTQCLTCFDAREYWNAHRCLPRELQAAIDNGSARP